MIFLRFPDEQAYSTGIAPYLVDGVPTIPNLDVIGTIYEGGEWDVDGNVVSEPTTLPGYHVNLVGDAPPGFEPYVIERPNHPYRVFFGHP